MFCMLLHPSPSRNSSLLPLPFRPDTHVMWANEDLDVATFICVYALTEGRADMLQQMRCMNSSNGLFCNPKPALEMGCTVLLTELWAECTGRAVAVCDVRPARTDYFVVPNMRIVPNFVLIDCAISPTADKVVIVGITSEGMNGLEVHSQGRSSRWKLCTHTIMVRTLHSNTHPKL
jgi:hypothetical protein